MRILLVQPAPFEDNRLGLENTFWLSEPVGLTSIGTMVQDEHEVLILDMRLEEPAKLPENSSVAVDGCHGYTFWPAKSSSSCRRNAAFLSSGLFFRESLRLF